MVEVLKSPITRKAAVNAITGLGKLGIFAVASVFTGKVFKQAVDAYVAILYQDIHEVKSLMVD
jgi:hypothetical protein